MIQFLWDASAWDWGRGSMDLISAKSAGIVGFSHRATTGTTYKDPNLSKGIAKAMAAGIEIFGAYMVPRTKGNNGNGSIYSQVDYFLQYLDDSVHWWRSYPYFFIQVDTEKWRDAAGKVVDDVAIEDGRLACYLLDRYTKKRIIHYAPRWAYSDTIPTTYPLWNSHYVGGSGDYKKLYPGDNFDGWKIYSNQVPIFLQYSDNSTIGNQVRCDINAFRGTLDDLKKFVGKEAPTMTYAPGDLLIVRNYVRTKTGLPDTSMGIVGDTSHNSSGGYHVGRDVMSMLGTAPEQPGGDYSYTESQRDRNGLTNAASAFDLGGAFPRFREITVGIVNACKAGDPRTRDIREVIYTDNGTTVKRWDALGRRTTGDSSHLQHTHVSFFRDSDGRRDDDDNFLGLLKELFDGKPQPPRTGEGDDMGASLGPFEIPVTGGSFNIPPVQAGAADPRPAWFNVCNDTFGKTYALRIWASKGDKTWFEVADKLVLEGGQRWSMGLPSGTCVLSITRRAADPTKPDDIYQGHLTWCLERGAVG